MSKAEEHLKKPDYLFYSSTIEGRRDFVRAERYYYKQLSEQLQTQLKELAKETQCQHKRKVWVKQIAETYCPECREII